jgi:hypothetical protein
MTAPRHWTCLVALLSAALCGCGCACRSAVAEDDEVFRRPALVEESRQLQLRALAAARGGDWPIALELCQQAVNKTPFSATATYHLACLQASRDQADESLVSLKQAIELGFRDAKALSQNPDFASLRKRDEFAALIKSAQIPFPAPEPKSGSFEDGIAWVGPANTVWDESTNLLRTGFDWQRPAKPPGVVLQHGEIGKRLRKWFDEGTAAGNFGDLYDNCDRDHSNLKYAEFPQLQRVEYRPVIEKHVPFGLQNRFLHGGVVIGNSSTSLVNSPVWRSNPRMAYGNPASMGTLSLHYFANHLYIYPEHEDHDPGHNGKGGYGDVYPANTPYMLISQGSSYTDQPFLDALACTLAAFRPEVKELLAKHHLISPTLQQVFRSSYKLVVRPDDYFTGLAHPSVFDGSLIDPLKMIEAAHALTPKTIPPVARLRVEQQDQAVVGRDYFEIGDRETLFDTPCAIARIGRSTKYRRRMLVSARESFDVNQHELKFRWVLLRGDASRISITPQNESGSQAEIAVAWQPRRRIRPTIKIESNRVDIGVFAHNGSHWSAPAFVTWFFLDNEERVYDDEGRIRSVVYHGGSDAGNYVDPLIQTPKTWKDTYRYTEAGRLIGWTRSRDGEAQEMLDQFTADGGLVIEQDDQGRALTAREVRYVAQPGQKQLPILVQQLGDKIWRYAYDNSEDQIGHITSREDAPSTILNQKGD